MSRRLRVLLVIRSRQVWGLERTVLDVAPLMAARGVDVALGSPPGGELSDRWRALGLAHVPLGLPSRSGLRAADGERRLSPFGAVGELAASARATATIAAALGDVDVVHSVSLWSHLDCALAGRLARRPVAVELVDIVRPGLGRTVLSSAVRLSSETFAISGAVAECVHPRVAGRVRIVAPGVDTVRFRPAPADQRTRRELSSDPSAPLVGIVGRIDPEKGIDVLVRAVAGLRGAAARTHLVVVGSSALAGAGFAAAVEAEARSLLGDRVRFVGRRDDIPTTLRALDVLVNASRAEPFGLSILEAQACGVPVVATSAGGVPDLVRHGDNGLLVGRDERSLGQALERLVDDAGLRAELGRRGHRSAQQRTVSQRADAIADVYRRCARGGRGRQGGARVAELVP